MRTQIVAHFNTLVLIAVLAAPALAAIAVDWTLRHTRRRSGHAG